MVHFFVIHLTILGYFKLKKMHKTTKTNRKMLVKLAQDALASQHQT